MSPKCESSELGETYTPKNIWLSVDYSFVDARKHLLASGSTSFLLNRQLEINLDQKHYVLNRPEKQDIVRGKEKGFLSRGL